MRAQTTLDFAIGISVFLLVVTFVFSFVPGTFQPFEANTAEETALADRLADQIAGNAIGTPGASPALDVPCTLAFFRAAATDRPTCPFDQSVTVPGQLDDAFRDRVGLAPRQRLAVTITSDTDGDGTPGTLCWDDATATVVEVGVADCEPGTDGDVRLSIGTGESPTRTGSVVVARRLVVLVGQDATLEVHAW